MLNGKLELNLSVDFDTDLGRRTRFTRGALWLAFVIERDFLNVYFAKVNRFQELLHSGSVLYDVHGLRSSERVGDLGTVNTDKHYGFWKQKLNLGKKEILPYIEPRPEDLFQTVITTSSMAVIM